MRIVLAIFLSIPLCTLGQYFPGGQTVSNNSSYCYRGGNTYTDVILPLPEDPRMFRVKNYGAVGDGVTNDSAAIYDAIIAATNYITANGGVATVYFPQGTFVTTWFNHVGYDKSGVAIRGRGMDFTNIKSKTSFIEGGFFDCRGLTFENISLKDFFTTRPTTFLLEGVEFKTSLGDKLLTSNAWCGVHNDSSSYYFKNCRFNYDTIYKGIAAFDVAYLFVYGCSFSGVSTHPIRMDYVDSAYISSCNVSGGTTGIFAGSQRVRPLENITVINNIVHGQEEEGISFDGFGNNTSLCPVIGQGRIDSVYNNGGGKTVMKVHLLYRKGTHPADETDTLLISDRTDWTNFYFCFGDDSDFSGRYYKITAFDSVKNTLTIDTTINKAVIDSGWTCSVDAGFFNCTVANNEVYDVWGIDSTYGTGISLWLNVFNTDVYGNNIHDCAHGLNASGGTMLNLYQAKAWRTNIHNNTFLNCPVWGASLQSFYGANKQYDNIFKDNILNGNTLVQEDQLRFTNTGNTP